MASGNTLNTWFPQAAFFQASGSYPAVKKRGAVPILAYDDTTDETAWFAGVMPRHYAGGGVTFTIGWMFRASGTPGTDTCQWEISFLRVQDDTDDLDGTLTPAAANTVLDTSASADGELSYAEIAFTDGADMDSVAAGELFLIEVVRNAQTGTASPGDAEIVFIEMRET